MARAQQRQVFLRSDCRQKDPPTRSFHCPALGTLPK
eukprot:COSAG04_NODE_28175_length_277_cov_0.859551_1_plen_35_part_10